MTFPKLDFERWGETLVGAAVALVAVGFFAFAAAQGGNGASGAGAKYTARFQRIDGIDVGADVRVAGVKVGVVSNIDLDPETYLARVTMTINPKIQVLNESQAKVQSDSLLGGAHIAIEQAGFEPLAPGGEILNTQGSVDILTLLSSAAQTLGGGGQAPAAKQESSP